MSRTRKYSHSLTNLEHSLAFFEKHEVCILIKEELCQCVLYIVRYTNSSEKELRLIAPKNTRIPYFLLMFGRRQIIDKHTDLKI